MHCYHLISLTFVLIADRKIFAQESDFFFDVPLIGTENDNLFSAPAQDMFEKLDDGDWTLPMLPAESPLDFLVGNFDSCDNVQSFGRIRARSDDSCINDQPVPEESGPRLDLGEIFAPLRNIQTQEDLVNFICPSWAFQGILDIPVCSETGDLSATPIDTNSINDLISSQLSQFELFDVEFAYLLTPSNLQNCQLASGWCCWAFTPGVGLGYGTGHVCVKWLSTLIFHPSTTGRPGT